MIEKLEEIEKRFEQVDRDYNAAAMAGDGQEMQRLGKSRAELEPVVELTQNYRKALNELRDAEELLGDPEMREMAQAEIEPLRARIEELELNLKNMLVAKDPNDDKSVIVEIRPAAGG